MITISAGKFDSLLRGDAIGELIAKALGNRGDAKSAVDEYVKTQLSDEQAKKLSELLADENAARAMMASPEAKKLMQLLMGGVKDE